MERKKQTPVEKLRKWLRRAGNSPAIVAAKLDYKTTGAVTQWLKRGRIPGHRVKAVMEVISAKSSN